MRVQALSKACEFLVSVQRADGGWGESYLSCQDKVYTQLPGEESHVVNTGWGLLGLIAAGSTNTASMDAAARCLVRMQLPNGDWPQQHISGVFNRNCMITYANYRYDAAELLNLLFNFCCLTFRCIWSAVFVTYSYCTICRNIFPIWALGEYSEHVLNLMN